MKHLCQKTYSWLSSLFLAVMFVMGGTASAQDVTFDFLANANGQWSTMSSKGLKVTYNGYEQGADIWNINYAMFSISLESEAAILKVEFEGRDSYWDGSQVVEANGKGTFSFNANGTSVWEGSANELRFVGATEGTDFYVTNMRVWLEGGGVEEVDPQPAVDLSPLAGNWTFQGTNPWCQSSGATPAETYDVVLTVEGDEVHMTGFLGEPYAAAKFWRGTYDATAQTLSFTVDSDPWFGSLVQNGEIYYVINDPIVFNVPALDANKLENASGWTFAYEGYYNRQTVKYDAVALVREGGDEPEPQPAALYTIKRTSDGRYLTTNEEASNSNFDHKYTYTVGLDPEYFYITPADAPNTYYIQSENGKNVGMYPSYYDWNVIDSATPWEIADIEGNPTTIINALINSLNAPNWFDHSAIHGMGFDADYRIFGDKTNMAYWVIEKVVPVVPVVPVTFEFAENEDGNIVVTPSDLEKDYVVFYVPAEQEDQIADLVAEEIALAGGDYFTGEFEIGLAQFAEMGVFGDFLVVAASVKDGAVGDGGIFTYPFHIDEVVRPLSFDIFVDGNELSIEPSKADAKYWWTIVCDDTNQGMNDEVFFENSLQGVMSYELLEGNAYADLTEYFTHDGEYRVLVGEVVRTFRGFGLGGELFTKVINYVAPVEPEPVYGEDGTATFANFYEYNIYEEPISVAISGDLYAGVAYFENTGDGFTVTADEGYAIAKITVKSDNYNAHNLVSNKGVQTIYSGSQCSWEYNNESVVTLSGDFEWPFFTAAVSELVVDYVALNKQPAGPTDPEEDEPSFGDGVAEFTTFKNQTTEGPIVVNSGYVEAGDIWMYGGNPAVVVSATNNATISRITVYSNNTYALNCAEGALETINAAVVAWTFEGAKTATIKFDGYAPAQITKIDVEYTTPAPAGWQGEIKHLVAANNIDDLLDYEMEFVGAKSVQPCAMDVLGAIYDETGNPYAIVYAGEQSLFGSVEFAGNHATVHFVKIADLNSDLQAATYAAAKRLLGAFSGNGCARVVFSGSSFVVDKKSVDLICEDYNFGGMTTGIDAIATEKGNTIYDLSGRRVNDAQGNVFIMNSRKQYMK